MTRLLSHEQARAFYDRFGSRQDLQRFYENAAIAALVTAADFEHSHAVVELGCGTGALARDLLERRLPPQATYLGLDVSRTMIDLARRRVAPWRGRARVELTTGEPRIPLPDGSCDRFLSTYVLDLLSDEDIRGALSEAERVLAPEGLLCLASLTFGQTATSRVVCRFWRWLHALHPQAVGGCRPLWLLEALGQEWLMLHREVVCAFGLCTEVVVARAKGAVPA